MLQQSHIPLTNGIVSFLHASEDYNLAPIGIGSMHEQAQKLAEFGRHGDIYFIHAAEGETVIPLEVLNANPKVKDMLFNQMREMGLDPEEFVVGNELNSINPVTGMPEFFFSSLWRSVKRIAKKIAPVVLPLAAAAFGVPFLGPAFAAGTFGASFLASGIGTLIQGGDLGDAFKSGLVSGGLTSLAGGLSGAFSKTGTFMGGLEGSFTGATPVFDPATKIQTGLSYTAAPWAESGFNPTGVSDAALKAAQAQSTAQWNTILGRSGVERDILGGILGGGGDAGFIPETPGTDISYRQAPPPEINVTARAPVDLVSAQPIAAEFPDPNWISGTYLDGQVAKAPQWLSPAPSATLPRESTTLGKMQQLGAVGSRQASQAQIAAEAAFIKKAKNAPWYSPATGGTRITATDFQAQLSPDVNIPIKLMEKAMANVNPGPLRTWGPLAAGLGLAAYAGGAFDPVEEDPTKKEDLEGFVKGPTGAELVKKYRERYVLPEGALDPLRYNVGRALVPSIYQAAHGGLAEYPPRDLLVEGAGTERSDEIPAMLSDGEFVMNAKSVRGADPSGRGNRYAGANNLYNMMRNFEMRS
jgi:hypothetical protein